MIYPFPNFNGATVEVWEWIRIRFYISLGVRLLAHDRIKVNPCLWKEFQDRKKERLFPWDSQMEKSLRLLNSTPYALSVSL